MTSAESVTMDMAVVRIESLERKITVAKIDVRKFREEVKKDKR